MNPKRITLALIFALLVSGLCTWLVARRIDTHAAAPKLPDLQYAAPARALQAGETLRPESLELVAWPASHPIDGAYARTADIAGREVLFPLGKGQPILSRDLSSSGTGLAGKIPDGMRAIALRSDEVVGVAGFLVPGSHLDVLVTYRTDRSPEPVTATVLQNAVVIAAGQKSEPDPDGKPSSATVVTLLLTPEQSERAVLASTQGTIHFVLRNGLDSGQTHEEPMQLSQLAGEPAAAVHVTAAAPRTAAAPIHMVPREIGIETVLGGSESTSKSAEGPNGGSKQ